MTELVPQTAHAEQRPVASQSPALRRLKRLDVVFIVTVLLPTIFSILYFGVIASDVYISESRFVVRNPQRPMQSGLGALLQGTVFSRSQDETYSVHDFIRSRDALRELESNVGMRSAYSDGAIDFINRFPGLEPWDQSFEALHRHYLRHVTIDYDTVSSISILKVRAYTSQDAERINNQLLEMGERLVNTMNLRSRRDLIQVAEQEVSVAEQRAKAASSALSSFRSERSVFDPDRQSALQLQGVARLREELLAAESQLDQVKKVSPNNPQVFSLEQRVKNLREAVSVENAQVLGKNSGLSAKSPAYDRLQLEKQFADRQLVTALAALDSARNEASRKQLYLERLVQPNLPDRAVEPRRIRSILGVLLVGLLLWGVISLVLASVREHTA